MVSINTNVGALAASRSLSAASLGVDVPLKRVSTGLRVAGALDDASSFSIAQGVRSEIAGFLAVETALRQGAGVIKVALAGATGISELITDLRSKVVEFFSASSEQQPILQKDLTAILSNIDLLANAATFGGVNLINKDQASIAIPPPPDAGITFSITDNGTATHVVGTVDGSLSVSFTATGADGKKPKGTVDLIFDGNVVGTFKLNKPNNSGVLNFAFPGTPSDSFTLELRKSNATTTLDYAFQFVPNTSGFVGEFKILSDLLGDEVDVQFNSLLTGDIGLGTLNLSSLQIALGQVDAAEEEVLNQIAHLGSRGRRVASALESAQRFGDILSEGLGNVVDADLGRESARLIAAQVRESLALEGVAIANRRPEVFAALLDPAVAVSRLTTPATSGDTV